MISAGKLSLIVLLGACIAHAQQSSGKDYPERNAMDKLAKKYNLTQDMRDIPPTTKAAHGFDKGVRGFGFYDTPEYGNDPEDPDIGVIDKDGKFIHISPFTSESEVRLHRAYCAASSVVTVTYLDSQTRITSGHSMIYTVNRFIVGQVIKTPNQVVPRETITLVTLGGTVYEEGETLTMNASDTVVFQKNEQYLLLLSPLENAPDGYFLSNPEAAVVRNNELYRVQRNNPSTITGEDPIPFLFLNGEDLDHAKERIADVLKKSPCPTP